MFVIPWVEASQLGDPELHSLQHPDSRGHDSEQEDQILSQATELLECAYHGR